MTGPRLFSRTHLMALAALMLLPACSPRKPIPSDPPEVRTEAQVRGARTAPKSVEAAKPVVIQEAEAQPAQAKPDELVARMSDEAKPADVKPVDVKPVDAKPVAPKPAEAKPVQAAPAEATAAGVKAEAVKTADVKTDAAKAVEAKAAEVKAADAKPAAKPGASEVDKIVSDVAATADAVQPAKDAAKETVRPAIVQIASFGTEKNAQGALSWLKEKGYSESRVVRVEQGQTVYHRVQAGPFQDLDAARKALEELKADWPQAFIPAD
jgi:hypothetical protein